MQAMCHIYAAISYICIGNAESSSKVNSFTYYLYARIYINSDFKKCFPKHNYFCKQALDLIGPILSIIDSFVGVREKTSVLLAHGFLLMRQQNLQEARYMY